MTCHLNYYNYRYAFLQKEKLPLSALHYSLVNLYRMIDPLLAMIDFADTLNETSVTFRVLKVLTEDTCNWVSNRTIHICIKHCSQIFVNKMVTLY